MATDYTAIIAALDAGIATRAASPVEIRAADGRTYKYSTLPEMIAARQHFASLQHSGQGLRVCKMQSGSGRV